MPGKPQSQSLAVLIDAENTSARHAHAIFEEIVKLGEANVRRIYGDFPVVAPINPICRRNPSIPGLCRIAGGDNGS